MLTSRQSQLAAGVTATGAVAFFWWRRKNADLSGQWYTIIHKTGDPTGDQYEFRQEGNYYIIYRGGKTGHDDRFIVNGSQVEHNHGPKATIQPNGDIHWDIEGGKYASRRKGFSLAEVVALSVPSIVMKTGAVFMSLVPQLSQQCVSDHAWPPAHTPADSLHFMKLKREGGVDQVWLISKHDGSKYVQHNFANGTYKAYEINNDNVVDAGTWTLVDGKYSEVSNNAFTSEGKLRGHAKSFYMEVQCGPHGYHKFTPTFEQYLAGHLGSELPSLLPADIHAPPVRLVRKGSSEALFFQYAEALAKGEEFVPLTLRSSMNKAIVNQSPRPEVVHNRFRLIAPAVGSAEIAVHARLDKNGGFLTCQENGFVLDVNKWEYEEGNKLWMLQEGDDVAQRPTRNPDGGRSFQVNLDDGTISPIKAPHIVLGVATKAQLTLVPKGSPKMCVFEHAGALKAGGVVKPLTLLSPAGLAVVTMYEQPRNFQDYCEYIELGVASVAAANPLCASFDEETWLMRDTIVVTTTVTQGNIFVAEPVVKEYNMVFDVAMGRMEPDNAVNMLQRLGNEPSKEPGNKAREFKINDDGTISPKAAPELVLGMEFLPLCMESNA